MRTRCRATLGSWAYPASPWRDPDCGILATMPELITEPSRVAAAGQPPKLIDEYVGRANTGQDGLSIAHMRSPSGWAEPGQRPEDRKSTRLNSSHGYISYA